MTINVLLYLYFTGRYITINVQHFANLQFDNRFIQKYPSNVKFDAVQPLSEKEMDTRHENWKKLCKSWARDSKCNIHCFNSSSFNASPSYSLLIAYPKGVAWYKDVYTRRIYHMKYNLYIITYFILLSN